MNKNKPTRRGMGVAKLERWLEAEKWGGGGGGDPYNQFQTVATSPSVYVGSDLFMSKSSSSSSSFIAASSKVISTLGDGGCKELSSIPKVIQYHHQCDASSYSKVCYTFTFFK